MVKLLHLTGANSVEEKYRIRRYDNLNIVLEHYRQGKNPITRKMVWGWHIVGYFGTLGMAIRDLVNDVVDLNIEVREGFEDEVLDAIERAKDTVLEKLENIDG